MVVSGRQKGFTIIEILIVLAIVSLILLVVFLAVPALQRTSRNAQRKRDALTSLAFIQEYILANNNRLPNSSCNNTQPDCFLRDATFSYYDNKTLDSNNVSLWNRFSIGPFNDESDPQLDPEDPRNLERLSIRTWSKCNGTDITGVNARKQDIAAQYVLETFSSGTLQCVEM